VRYQTEVEKDDRRRKSSAVTEEPYDGGIWGGREAHSWNIGQIRMQHFTLTVASVALLLTIAAKYGLPLYFFLYASSIR